MQIQINLAVHDDLEPWLGLAEEVAPLFGLMPDFDAVLIRKIAQQQAYCARTNDGDREFAGGVIIGGGGDTYAIRWLAVRSSFQRLGVGNSLVNAAIAKIPAQACIYVDTFVAGSPGAVPARKFYENCGFTPRDIWTEGKVVRQRYVRLP
ncbi:GNAT family N-acetyltransferase [Rhizobium sp. FKY42]|uniref:GNAT family N-acetyltransferase n=1 Tax=Rhizobium sp. FKY42 TaxID=2562310 RepID=UPI0014859BD3|nr:GNAT family N-acetyltransferase [Rhizobium sp. FKY42]